jgi:hypothetical protein
MKQPSKEDTLKKWEPILDSMGITGSKADWMSQYANAHLDNETQRDNKIEQILESNTDNEFPNLLPIAMKISAQTVGLDLVSVQPMSGPGGMSQQERERIEAEVKGENRDGKIDALIEGKEYTEKKVEDHPDYKSGGGQLFYLDYTYGDNSEKEEEEESPILGRKKKK